MQTGSFTHTHTHTWVIRLSGREMCYKNSAAAAGRQTTCAYVICKRNAMLVAKGSLRLQKTTPRVLRKGRGDKREGTEEGKLEGQWWVRDGRVELKLT